MFTFLFLIYFCFIFVLFFFCSLLKVREAAYDLLLALGRSHPLLRMQAALLGGCLEDERENLMSDDYGSEGMNGISVDVDNVGKKLWSLLLNGFTDPDSEGMEDDQDNDDTERKRQTENEEENSRMDVDENESENEDDLNERYFQEQKRRDGAPSRIGIRRKVFNFFNEQLRFTGDPYERLNVLMTKLFEPSRTDNWLQYASYLLLCLSKEDKEAYSKPLFDRQLASDCYFTPINLSGMSGPGSQDTSSLPLFSLERSYSQYSQSQLQYQNNIGAYGTQSEHVHRNTGHVRGTQQISWTQTQSSFSSIPIGISSDNINDRNKGNRGRERGRESQLLQGRKGKSNSSQFRNPLSTQSLFSSGPKTEFLSKYHRNIPNQNFGSQFAAAVRSQSTQSSQNGQFGTFGLMGPPIGLPSYFTGKEISTVIQRVPLRFKKVMYGNSVNSRLGSSSSNINDDKGKKIGENDDNNDEKYLTSASSSSYSSVANRFIKKIADDKLKRKNKITIYREYKNGELPNICLPLKDLLEPLRNLCLKDSKISSIVFTNIFYNLYNNLSLQSTISKTMRINIKSILINSKSNDTNFTSTILNTCCKCLESEDPRSPKNNGMVPQGGELLVLSSAVDITEAAMKSLNFHAGIQYLENLLLVSNRINECVLGTAQETKKSKLKVKTKIEDDNRNDNNNNNNNILSILKDDKIIWQQLSRLYSALGEYDILLGLAEKISVYHIKTRKAIDAEVSGDYRKAVKMYADLLISSRER